jgi:hypothetical protein
MPVTEGVSRMNEVNFSSETGVSTTCFMGELCMRLVVPKSPTTSVSSLSERVDSRSQRVDRFPVEGGSRGDCVRGGSFRGELRVGRVGLLYANIDALDGEAGFSLGSAATKGLALWLWDDASIVLASSYLILGDDEIAEGDVVKRDSSKPWLGGNTEA